MAADGEEAEEGDEVGRVGAKLLHLTESMEGEAAVAVLCGSHQHRVPGAKVPLRRFVEHLVGVIHEAAFRVERDQRASDERGGIVGGLETEGVNLVEI